MRAFLLCGVILGTAAARLPAAEPVFTHIHPAGVQAGTTVMVTLTGKFDPWPCQIHADAAGLTFAPRKEAGIFDLTVDPAVPPGPHLLRAFNAEGASAPVALMITREPQILEAEPNDDFRAPQVLESSTATVNGSLGKSDDVDSFAVNLSKGQTVVVRVEAYVLAAGFDAMLRITDAAGTTLAFNHDGPENMDPLLVFTAPADGKYVVQTMGHKYPAATDIRFQGGADCVYRLHLSTAPLARHAWPLAVPAARTGAVTVEGWNLPGSPFEFEKLPPFLFPAPSSDLPELTENAPPQTLAVPSAVSGRIAVHGETDRYLFPAKKGEILDLSVSGPELGSEMDARIQVLDEKGIELAVNDDAGGSSEPRLVWTAPADGIFTAAVGEVTQRGGADYYYRLALIRPLPVVTATVAGHAFKIESGGSREIKISVAFANGFAAPLTLSAQSLPAGLSAPEVTVPEKGGEVTLTLTAEKNAPPVSLPFRLVLTEKGNENQARHPVGYRMISTTENNGVPQGYRRLLVNGTSDLWLTVTAPPAPEQEKGK